MAKYIKREDAVFAACKVLDKFGGCKMGSLCPDVGCSEVRDIVDQYICKDVVERKTGKWVGYPACLKYMNAYADDHIVCSACEECFSILDNDCERFNFCPNCGADMRQEKGDGNV